MKDSSIPLPALEAQSFWTNDDPRLHMLSWDGEGTPLLLLHGMAGNAHWWDGVAPRLLDRSRPVALDFQGHGDSGWRADGAYDAKLFGENVETARQSLGWGKMALAAHSMGARIALDYAAHFPERVSALVVIDFLPELLGYEERSPRFERVRARRQPSYSDPEVMLKRFHLEPPGTLLDEKGLRAVGERCLRKTEKGWSWKFDWRAFLTKYDPVWPLLPKISVPTLIVRGEHSTVLPRSAYDRLLKGLPGARGADIARSYHHVPLDCPAELAAEMKKFLCESC